MENNPSKKKFRGFKYMVLVLLVSAAFGLAWFAAGGPQTGEQQATMKDKASTLVADAKEQGKSLMGRADDIKEDIGDAMTKGSDKVSSVASDVGDKAGERVQAASNTGSDLVERAQSTAEKGKKMIEGATSTIGSGETVVEDTGPWADISEQASSALDEGRSEASAMIADKSGSVMEESSSAIEDAPSMSFKDDTSLSFKDTSTPSGTMFDAYEKEIMKSGMDQALSAQADKVSDKLKEQMSDARNDTRVDASDRPMSNVASSKSQEMGDEAEAKKRDTSGASAIRCLGTPPKGKDEGDYYIVAVCETMSIISERTGVGVEELKNRNPQVDNPDLIFPNQRLWLPPRG